MVHRQMLSLLLIACLAGQHGVCCLHAQETTDLKALVNSLVSKNSAPKIVRTGSEYKPFFDQAFDWDDQARVDKAVTSLAKHIEAAWPYVVGSLSDRRYCITYEAFESPMNYTGR